MKPPTMAEAEARGLIVEKGIHTFSNGSQHEAWADNNCFDCWYYDPDRVDECAFEGAAMLGMASPALAVLFGWTQSPEYANWRGAEDPPNSSRHGWHPPKRCPFFRSRENENGGENPPPPEPDPAQLVLIADPTEAIHGVHPATELAVFA